MKTLSYELITTPIGNLIALADEQALWFLQFADSLTEPSVQKFMACHQLKPNNQTNKILAQTASELEQYFTSNRTKFTILLKTFGTSFQQASWQILQQISYGTTISYQEQAESLQKPTAYRAVAQANSANHLTIVIPCHRVINKNKKLGGYSNGVHIKKWLLKHEAEVISKQTSSKNI